MFWKFLISTLYRYVLFKQTIIKKDPFSEVIISGKSENWSTSTRDAYFREFYPTVLHTAFLLLSILWENNKKAVSLRVSKNTFFIQLGDEINLQYTYWTYNYKNESRNQRSIVLYIHFCSFSRAVNHLKQLYVYACVCVAKLSHSRIFN